MGFMDAVKTCFNKYADFKGRARRSEYWYFVLFNLIVSMVLNALYKGMGWNIFSVISSVYSIAILVPALAVVWRRLHDIGKGGANYLFILIPLVGWIFVLVWCCRDGQPGDNAFGPDPKSGERVVY